MRAPPFRFHPHPQRIMLPRASHNRTYRFVWRLVCLVSFVCVVVGYVKQDDIAHIRDIHTRVLEEPVQTPLVDEEPITFFRDGFQYALTPVAQYDMSALVVHHLNYNKWYSLSRVDKAFEIDLCVMWGKNVAERAYTIPSLSIKQDFRFCIYRFSGAERVYGDAFANNHLIATDPRVVKTIHHIRAGDQVRLEGKLVHVSAQRIGAPKGTYEPSNPSWRTSTIRTDSGAGACEVLYVERVHILREGNVWYRMLYLFGLYGLMMCFLVSCVRFFYSMYTWKTRYTRVGDGVPIS